MSRRKKGKEPAKPQSPRPKLSRQIGDSGSGTRHTRQHKTIASARRRDVVGTPEVTFPSMMFRQAQVHSEDEPSYHSHNDLQLFRKVDNRHDAYTHQEQRHYEEIMEDMGNDEENIGAEEEGFEICFVRKCRDGRFVRSEGNVSSISRKSKWVDDGSWIVKGQVPDFQEVRKMVV